MTRNIKCLLTGLFGLLITVVTFSIVETHLYNYLYSFGNGFSFGNDYLNVRKQTLKECKQVEVD